MTLEKDSVALWALSKRAAARKLAGAHLLAFGAAVLAVVAL